MERQRRGFRWFRLAAFVIALGVVLVSWLVQGKDPADRLRDDTGTSRPSSSAPAQPDSGGPDSAGSGSGGSGGSAETGSLPTIALSELPPEARETIRLIEQGGPFPYDEDGSVFENREGLLPDRPRGSYREYTVETPGSDDRGARRIVVGGGTLYWTDDHYQSFHRVEEDR